MENKCKKDLISVVLPIYNKEDTLRICLNSILNQTYSNLEVILVDDGSSDDTCNIANEFVKKDRRFKYYYQNNAGPSVARNLGIEKSNGKWISFVDPDDSIKEDFFSVLIQNIDNDVDICACCCLALTKNGIIENHFFENNKDFFDDESKKMLYLSLMDINYNSCGNNITGIGVPWGKLYRKQFLVTNNLLFDARLKRMQDNIFNMYAFKLASKIKYVNEPLYLYNCDNIQMISHKFDKNTPDYYGCIIELRKQFLIKNNLFEIKEIYDTFCLEIFAIVEMILGRCFLNSKYNENRKLGYKKFIGNYGILKYIQKLPFKKVKSFRRKIKLLLLKLNLFYVVILLYKRGD